MKTIAISLAALSLAFLGWQFGPSRTAQAEAPAAQVEAPHPFTEQAQSIDFVALHAEARAALQRLQEKHRTDLSMNERYAKPATVYR